MTSWGRALRRRADRVHAEQARRAEIARRIAQRELTFWNGEPTPCRKVRVLVAANPDAPAWVTNRFAGTSRDAVEVVYGGRTFYLDDEGYEQTDEERERLAAAAEALVESVDGRMTLEQARGHYGVEREQVGYPGWGWAKVTHGRGSPRYGHLSLMVDRVLGERD